ncbi:hypothetical protein QA612_07040 [Evansella sp. AB-P1]|uniref:DUF6199 family natural product biosynthesis protein n=1 Tax=Evansella sp. AB-P1 TaxID=3037653 RepID=UPI00241D8CF6|nr:DUF6199 family natural product biosynthesis protein [Evansella sp. AB-P1]MDG5787244.1 hypothetical protein [Evansella sp. AB-P1]
MKGKTSIMMFVLLLSFFQQPLLTDANVMEKIELSNGEIVTVHFRGEGDSYRYEVTFESGETYFHERRGNITTGGGSSPSESYQILGEEAIEQFEKMHGNPTEGNTIISGNPLGVLVILLGAIGLFFPYVLWYLEIGWKLKDAEPSDFFLLLNRIIGVVIIFVGIFMLF